MLQVEESIIGSYTYSSRGPKCIDGYCTSVCLHRNPIIYTKRDLVDQLSRSVR